MSRLFVLPRGQHESPRVAAHNRREIRRNLIWGAVMVICLALSVFVGFR